MKLIAQAGSYKKKIEYWSIIHLDIVKEGKRSLEKKLKLPDRMGEF